MEGMTLKEQLDLIQNRQKQRFKQKRKKLEETDQEHQILIKAHQSDLDLELRTCTQDEGHLRLDNLPPRNQQEENVPDDSKEMDFLRSQFEQLQLENSQLKSSLQEREKRLSDVMKLREEERMALAEGSSLSATQRIVDLSKKNRELNAEIVVEKNRVRQLQKKLKEVESQNASSQDYIDEKHQVTSRAQARDRKHPPEPTGEDESLLVSRLQEQLQHAKQKSVEHRNQCQVLKQELKLAQKVISKEVGEEVSMSALLSGMSGWRGRAQQIASLQNKVTELKDQLACFKQSGKSSTRLAPIGSSSSNQADSRQKAMLQKIAQEKRKNLEDVQTELESLRADYSKLQQQYTALKARNKTLGSELKTLRSKPTSTTPDSRVNSTTCQSISRGSSDFMDRCTMYSDHCIGEWAREKEELQQANVNLQKQLEKCLSQMKKLREESNRLQTSSKKQKSSGPSTAGPLPPVIPPPGSRRAPSKPSLARKTVSAGLPSVSLQLSCEQREENALAHVAQIERDKLVELMTSLQQRLDATTDELIRLDTEQRNLRHYTEKLEKQLGRRGKTHAENNAEKAPGRDLEELETRLAVVTDENSVLRETLELTRHEKIEDMKLLHTMLLETKHVFMDSVRQCK